MLDYTTNPPTLRINEFVKDGELSLLQPNPVSDHGEIIHVYEIPELAEFTYNLMSWLGISYDGRLNVGDEPARKLEDFSFDEKRLYMPFAFMLACLDGNAFRAGQLNHIFENPDVELSEESISQYIPQAYRIMKANSADIEELQDMIFVANVAPIISPDSDDQS